LSHIDDLFAQHCPNGVRHKPLGDLGKFTRGRRFTKKDVVSEGVPSIHYGEIYTHYGTWTVEAVSQVRYGLRERLRYAKPGDVVVAGVGETVEDVGKAVAWLGAEEVAYHDDCFAFSHEQDPKYIAYAMQTADFHAQKFKYVARAKVKRLSGEGLAKIRIPSPPLEVQREIVRVLDLYTEAEAELGSELEAELDVRRKQYAYYRESLLTFTDDQAVQWIPLGELGQIFRGKRFTKKDYVSKGGIGVIHYGDIYTQYGTVARQVVSRVRDELGSGLRFACKGDIVLTDVGETVEDVGKAVAWLGDEDVAIHDHCYVIRSTVNPAYLSYYMQTATYSAAKNKHVVRTKVKTLLLDGLKRIPVPVPAANEQQRIVSILNKFDALVGELSVGLPAEIRARRKQYEYYRDQLLTLEELQ